MIGYKAFDKDLKCRDMQFAIGKTYRTGASKESLRLCSDTVIHFCRELHCIETESNYALSESRVGEVIASGDIVDDGFKFGTNEITILRELTEEEKQKFCNRNTGNWNTGNCNTGNYNSGDRNSGMFCSCSNSSGVFMTNKITYEAFDKIITKREYEVLIASEGFKILKDFMLYSYRTLVEKNGRKHIAYLSYKASWRMFWQTLTPKEKLEVKRIPHFDSKVFYEITGIRI